MSTPIETNTEELQGVLDRLYNLPNLGGSGKVSWDCVIEASDNKLTDGTTNFSVVSGSLRSVADKLDSGEKPNVILKCFVDNTSQITNYSCECLTMYHSVQGEREYLNLYFLFNDYVTNVRADSPANIDSNTLEYDVQYLLYD